MSKFSNFEHRMIIPDCFRQDEVPGKRFTRGKKQPIQATRWNIERIPQKLQASWDDWQRNWSNEISAEYGQ